MVLIDKSARVTRFLPKIRRQTMAARNGRMAVTTLAYGLRRSKMAPGNIHKSVARPLAPIKLSRDRAGLFTAVDLSLIHISAYAKKLGVDIDNLLVSQPDYGEQALEITNTLTASGQIDVLVVDSCLLYTSRCV